MYYKVNLTQQNYGVNRASKRKSLDFKNVNIHDTLGSDHY